MRKGYLDLAFFNRHADIVARELLGCVLCMEKDGKVMRYQINETEAYMGPHDLACHSSKGRTARTEVLYGEPGTIYIYLIYGMYTMLNIVTGAREYPAAVLIRGAGIWDGPGKLTRALQIGRELNGAEVGKETGLWIEKGNLPRGTRVRSTPRIGVSYAKEWADTKLRFVLT